VSRAFEYNFTTLRISQAHVSLQCQPEGGTKAISLAWIGDLENPYARVNADKS
jgi:hypothetical protein